MVKVLYGKKGTGKTKALIDAANAMVPSCSGEVVFIDDSNQLMYDLKHEIRFINISDFPVAEPASFLGFLCGVVAENYDICGIFIDGITYIVKKDHEDLKDMFEGIKRLSEKFNIEFLISMNGQEGEMPEFIKEYIS